MVQSLHRRAIAVRNCYRKPSRAYTEVLRSRKELLPDELMPWVTSEAVKYFEARNLDTEHAPPKNDVFGGLPRRFPNAWHVLSLLGDSSDTEIACALPMA